MLKQNDLPFQDLMQKVLNDLEKDSYLFTIFQFIIENLT